eukprot:3808071-Amphidinium_carterae.2
MADGWIKPFDHYFLAGWLHLDPTPTEKNVELLLDQQGSATGDGIHGRTHQGQMVGVRSVLNFRAARRWQEMSLYGHHN